MNIDLQQFHQAFFDEAAEHVSELEQGLLALDRERPDHEILNGIFRAAHSIKGASGIFGFDDLAALTHALESLLDPLRAGRLHLDDRLLDRLLHGVDLLKLLLAAKQGGQHPASTHIDEVMRDLEQCLALVTLETGIAQSAASTPVSQDDDFGFFDETPTLDDEGFGFFEPLPIAEVAKAEANRPSSMRVPELGQNSVRIGVERIDQLIDLVGELVITQAMVSEVTQELDGARYERMTMALAQLARNTRDLQEAVMSIRMLPINAVFNRFPRMVRDVAAKLGKQVELTLSGEHTELDKGLIEKLADPLTHLVRNSIDHGIEPPDERLRANKPAKGRITLSAYQQNGSIVLEVRDDGRGLDRERILAKARERKLIVPENPSDEEVWQLIFAPGFSTAETVTDISGRGVGMDVVKRNLQQINGRVEIASVFGVGTTVTIRLPLTLAILDGMSVSVAGEIFIIPLTFIVESLQPADEAIKSVGGEQCLLRVREDYLPLLRLAEVFGLPDAGDGHGLVVVVESEKRRVALAVDELLGQQQVVLKSLEHNYRRIGGIAGATIMGNGRVALILDVEGVTQQWRPLSEAVHAEEVAA